MPSPLTIEMRSVARRLGLSKPLLRTWLLLRGERNFEGAVRDALRDAIRPGDTVWDIGAHQGRYSEQFSEWAGEDGRVVCFEPVSANFRDVCERTAGRANVTAYNVALSDTEGTLPMSVRGARSSLADDHEGEVEEVQVVAGDLLRTREGLPAPNVIKLDVEGFEEEALRGLDRTLDDAALRTILIEVHFGQLDARGRKHAPRMIEQQLKARGFATSWLPPSHLLAQRRWKRST